MSIANMKSNCSWDWSRLQIAISCQPRDLPTSIDKPFGRFVHWREMKLAAGRAAAQDL
jgi:hypothetical protein